ncbi:LacI family transcriptional regulator [Paenibacillus sp. N1-5-1-14]|uniref:LacI family DNA-binding transcriptional regulator n=1 Tax=Paenibacillus radicibacter TaxID=2972488 RepID=UPI002158FC41|nr:LacI family DNA-binding transcriptional regulator [Paenibacillus radicibacter]MCR8643461.1 LacI family transcriptional regulator [Paenibacillus radicibacter]
METKNTTLSTIAELAGVSKSTVSRVLSDHPRISQKTKDKIYEIIKELGYHPNEVARSLANKSTKTIGIVMPIQNAEAFYAGSFFQESLRGICTVASDNGYDILISTNKVSEVDAIGRYVNGKKVDGMILMRSKVKDEGIEYLLKSQFPFVLIGSYENETDIYSVDNDNFQASKDLTSYLIAGGKRRIGFIGGTTKSVVTVNRLNGYMKALEEHQLPINEQFILTDNLYTESSICLKSMFASQDKPDALIVLDDQVGGYVIEQLSSMGIQVPRDVKIAGFNNSSYFVNASLCISSIEIHAEEIGSKACQMLIDVMNNKQVSHKVIVDHQLVKRDFPQP